jgi:hypothetical protein
MRSMLLMTALSLAELKAAGRQINVAICNLGGLNQQLVSHAKAETDLVYGLIGVQIVWRACDTFAASISQARSPWFVIRLWNDKRTTSVGPASLDVMGEAFVDGPDEGTMADAYFQAIRATAELHNADAGVLLGYVVAHELGHLLLGPGHTPGGVMQRAWGQEQIEALRQRRLRFSGESAERIRSAIDLRTGNDRRAWGQ